jgi:hypothetical protein
MEMTEREQASQVEEASHYLDHRWEIGLVLLQGWMMGMNAAELLQYL